MKTTVLITAALAIAGCANTPDSTPRTAEGKVLAYCRSSMQDQTKITVGLFDNRFPCIIDQRKTP